MNMIEVLEEDDEVMVLEEHSEGVEEGSDKLSRTESNKSFNSLGEEVFIGLFYGKKKGALCPLIQVVPTFFFPSDWKRKLRKEEK